MKDSFDSFDLLAMYTSPVGVGGAPVVGRDEDVARVLDVFDRVELCNVCLLAEAGTGKTALVKALARADRRRRYFEVDVSRLLASNSDRAFVGASLKELFGQAVEFQKSSHVELVLFVDEFHQLVMMSDVGVEALKPLLAASGRSGIRFIGATTYREFHEFIAPNQALVERLWRYSLPELDRETTVRALRAFADDSGVVVEDELLGRIYDLTQLYVPENAQPRKSLLVLDAMIGMHRHRGVSLDFGSLSDVLKSSVGVDVAFHVDVDGVLGELNKRVLAQPLAVEALRNRLNVCVAGLNDSSRPMASFLFTGSTGVGKTELSKQLAVLLLGDKRAFIRLDMTEFASDDSLDIFRDELTRRVWERPHCVLLLDEIEKASGMVTRLLLQVLDDGRLLDRHHRVVPFTNAYIVLTTNAGSEVYDELSSEVEVSKETLRRYDRLIRSSIRDTSKENRFPPELLGRIDEIVPFAPLSEKTLEDIAFGKLLDLVELVENKHGVELFFGRLVDDGCGGKCVQEEELAESVIDFLVRNEVRLSARDGGARFLIARLTREVVSVVAEFVNRYGNSRRCWVCVDGELLSENESEIISRAKIVCVDGGSVSV